MVLLPIMDETLYNLQRQGRISFYVSIMLVLRGPEVLMKSA